MALLRGGTRIFGQDIRIGFPRDKSLTKEAFEKTVKENTVDGQFGTNISTSRGNTIGRFLGEMNQGEGFARPTRFKVRFALPESWKLGSYGFKAAEGGPPPERRQAESITDNQMKRNVEMMCNKVDMPNRDINTQAHTTYGPRREMPYAYAYNGQINCTFYGDKFLRQRAFFENWQSMMFNETTHNMNYYDSYVGHIDIYQLGSFAAAGDRDRIVYGVRLYECYPENIGAISYDYGSTDSLVQVPIGFRYKNWENLTNDSIDKATIGTTTGTFEMKENPDAGGWLSKLPPELQRVGRDVMQAGKRNLPIGKLTGGKLFPPF